MSQKIVLNVQTVADNRDPQGVIYLSLEVLFFIYLLNQEWDKKLE